ncbi:MAG: PEP/pyruvate-binding domain-containing protein, partial [Desulfosalsimonadaceae bacterium]|nr:PEP/pyruvate-binding domain-containing protein [Desulfosalsimonadaceae bacterium]
MIWKALFGSSRKKENVDSLKAKILKFQSLLNGNNHVLELIADAEESLGGDFLFDMQYLRWLSEQLESAVRGIVTDLNYISGNQYLSLADAFLKVRLNVENALLSKSGFPDAPLVMLLSDIGMEMSDVVGEKMARLGEIKQRLNCPVPEGFVVTGQACRAFFDQNDIRNCIRSVADALKNNSCSVKDAEERLTQTILRAEIPGKIIRQIKKNVSFLEKQSRDRLRLAVRSSAMGEDGRLSFAGLHETLLGVKPENAMESYKKVVASLFTSRAINYRLLHGRSIESAIMAVGFMTMIPSRSAGVLYTLDPLSPEKNHAIVSASPGLGKMVVEGEGHLDRFEISRSAPHSVLSKSIAIKENRYDVSLKSGTARSPLAAGEKSEPSVSDPFLTALTRVSLKIEKYMRSAQDIEWAENDQGEPVILQTRPLKIQGDTTAFTPKLREAIKNHRILISGSGMVACRGVAYGRVVVVPDGETMVNIPPNTVIVARYSSPILAELVTTASAVITDFGSPTSHLATITREMKIPSIMDVGNATRILKEGMEVTVDAEENIIYEGKIDALIQYEAMKTPSLEDIAEFHILSRMLRYISPLYLKNPQHPRFQPRYCTTYHDIIRFAHEKAVLYFFDGHYLASAKHSPYCKILDLNIPIDLKVIDIGAGLAPNRESTDTCKIEDIRCEPLRFLLEGLISPGAWTTDAAGMDFESFMSSLTRSSVITQSVLSGPQPNLAIVS